MTDFINFEADGVDDVDGASLVIVSHKLLVVMSLLMMKLKLMTM